MRDTGRIWRMLEHLGTAWIKQPDTRLGQLMFQLHGGDKYGANEDLFYVEDDVMLERIKNLHTPLPSPPPVGEE